MAFVLAGFVLAAGALLAAAALARTPLRGGDRAWLAAALAPGLGFGGLSLLDFFALCAGLQQVGVGAFVVVAAAVSVLGLRRGFAAAPDSPRRERLLSLSLSLCILVVTAAVASSGFAAGLSILPDGGFDAIAIWNARARFLFRLGPELREQLPLMKEVHADYPLHLPAALAAQMATLGEPSIDVPHATALAFFLGTPLLAWALLRRLAAPWAGAACALLLLATPCWVTHACSQLADVPLAYALLAATLGLASLLGPEKERRLPAPLAGFFVGLLGWTKNEGLLLAVVVTALFALFAGVRALGPLLLGAALPLLATALFKAFWASPNDLLEAGLVGGAPSRAFDLARWQAALEGVGRELVDVETWGFVWPFLAIAFLLPGKRRGRDARFLVRASFLFAAAYLLVYVLTPAPQDWHIRTSLARLMVQLLPTISASAFLLAVRE